MAYFLGRDVKVALTTEYTDKAIGFTAGSTGLSVASPSNTPEGMHDRDLHGGTDGTNAHVFAAAKQTTVHFTNPLSDLVGVDISLGAVDEDIAYMGKRTALKAEIKKETTVTLTMKKTDNFFSELFNIARYGIDNGGTAFSPGVAGSESLEEPHAAFGYRVHVALKDGAEVISIPNSTLTEYSVNLAADGVQEETVTFMSHVTPFFAGAEPVTTATTTGL
tara:strand:- start:112 stop:771 length:660 start_codon:yes stop_codon:yes gene_type:complete